MGLKLALGTAAGGYLLLKFSQDPKGKAQNLWASLSQGERLWVVAAMMVGGFGLQEAMDLLARRTQ